METEEGKVEFLRLFGYDSGRSMDIYPMKMTEITEKKSIELGDQTEASQEFVQAWDFGEFYRSIGRDVRRFSVSVGSTTYFVQGVQQKHFLGIMYLYIPRIDLPSEAISVLASELKQRGYTFIRIEPLKVFQLPEYFCVATHNRQPDHTLLLDVNASGEELLAHMHSKTRYNIRLAEKKGVRVTEESSADLFWQLNVMTVERDNFKNHNREYFEKLLQLPAVRQLVAWYEDTPIASVLLFQQGRTMYYFYGASANEYRNVMAPYLLQWQGMLLAKKLHCDTYDFWGIAETGEGQEREGVQCFHGLCWDTSHPLSGVTRFKVGFGGRVKAYPQAVDIVLQPVRYGIYTGIRKVLKKK